MEDLQVDAEASRTLEGELREMVERFVEDWGMAIELNVATEQPLGEPPPVCEQVKRIVREALTNAHQHAPSSNVMVTLKHRDGEAVARVQDNGSGFDVDALSDQEGHFGLKVMKARAERIDGTLDVTSAPGQGTTVALHWPIEEGE